MSLLQSLRPALARRGREPAPGLAGELGAALSTVVLILSVGAGVLVPDTARAARSVEDAVYTKAQARSGKKLYQQHCLGCHERGYFRQVLRTRQGETLDPLFELMVTQMPQNDPGSLSDAEYVDVIAYILSQARYAEGTKKLKVVDLSEIHIPPS